MFWLQLTENKRWISTNSMFHHSNVKYIFGPCFYTQTHTHIERDVWSFGLSYLCWSRKSIKSCCALLLWIHCDFAHLFAKNKNTKIIWITPWNWIASLRNCESYWHILCTAHETAEKGRKKKMSDNILEFDGL